MAKCAKTETTTVTVRVKETKKVGSCGKKKAAPPGKSIGLGKPKSPF